MRHDTVTCLYPAEDMGLPIGRGPLEQFQEKCVKVGFGDFAVAFRLELRKNK